MWLLQRATCIRSTAVAGARFLSQQSITPSVWVLTDGGLRSTLLGTALGKRLGNVELKTIVASKRLQMFPPIVQRYIVDWTSAPLAIPACLTLMQQNSYSVYAGFPNIPFLYFDQVVLPKYEAQFKLAKLGPYARQKNMIATNMPLLDISTPHVSKRDHTAVVVGGYSPQCRWYSEDANILAENIRRMVEHFHTKLVVVFTESTTDQVRMEHGRERERERIYYITVWDAMVDSKSAQERMDRYQDIIDHAVRVVVTADLDYATAHAASRR
ncbi:hypothetical protein BX666DRAFT_1857362 [Dichotomocladium elegans]|nr:hypothetical protein BX666DRAFT_1857362 [Dichotomocladium elegans]